MTHTTPIPHRSLIWNRGIKTRAAIIALIVGTLLTIINQPNAVFGPSELHWVPFVLMYLTPFVVVSVSHVLGQQAASRIDGRYGERHERFLMTLMSHGVARRAIALGGLIGLFNITLVLAIGGSDGGQSSPRSINLLFQTILLPVVIGTLSQSLSFRRAVGSTIPAYGKTAN